jgi:hypothetical protein
LLEVQEQAVVLMTEALVGQGVVAVALEDTFQLPV